MNNCGVRTVLSTVLGAGMGVMFGIFMGTMDTVRSAAGAAAWRLAVWFRAEPVTGEGGGCAASLQLLQMWGLCMAACCAAVEPPCSRNTFCCVPQCSCCTHGVTSKTPHACAPLQGAAVGGVAEYQNQTMKQAFREMLKNTASKSRCGGAGQQLAVCGTSCQAVAA